MPFDLVIDEETAGGHEARVSKTSVCGSRGAVAGTLRYFADRFGVPRASIEGTQIPERIIQRYARRGVPSVAYESGKFRDGLLLTRTAQYFGFILERETERLPNPFPSEFTTLARLALAAAVIRGETPHPDQSKVKRELDRLTYYWRRSGGRLEPAAPDRVASIPAKMLDKVHSWQDFLRTPLVLDADALVPAAERKRLEALPSSIHLYGDRVPVEYDVERGQGVVRIRLREGQARRLQLRDVPVFDRPLRFTVFRGRREAVRADSLDELRERLGRLTQTERRHLTHRGRRRRRR
jgi:hypothetical protein